MKLLTDATLNRDATVSRSRRLDFRMKSNRAVLGQIASPSSPRVATGRTVTRVGLMTPNLPYNGTSSPRTTRTDCDHLKTHMRRYFFNITNGIRTVVDADRVQLEDEEGVRLEALEMVADLREESHITGTDWSGWRVIVRDENGCECFEVKF
jgi:hypothetical protein